VLSFETTELGTYSFAPMAAASISAGEHDGLLGFQASKLGVSSNLQDWVGGPLLLPD
jgi:hypothetical protein